MSGATLRVYNPATLTAEELRAQFVARMPILERLLGELRGEKRPQHQLLVGPRGMGKTTLLRRLAVGVNDDAVLTTRWLPIPFEEEQYNVAHLSDFWANCLDALGDALEEAGDHAGAAAIDQLVDALPDAEARRADAAWTALIGWARANRRLVLLIDNLDLVLGRLDKDEEWTLRECLGDQEDLVVIAASPHALDADVDYSRAFFDYFAVTELRPLPLDEAEALLLTLGERFGAPKVARTIRESPGIFRALHALSGGNPRALVLLYNVLAHEDLDSAHGYLEGMLDLATPLFKARIEELAPQAQQVLVGLALAEDPLTPAELAARIRLDPTVTAVQLGRLAKDGLVTRIERPGTRAAAHLVSERVMALWYRMRASRRERRKLEAEVDFLEMLYGEERLRDHARRWALRERCADGDERGAMLSMVVGSRVGDEGLLASVAESFSGSLEKLRGIIGKLEEKDGEFSGVTTMAERMAMLKAAERGIRAADVDWGAVGVTVDEFVELLIGRTALLPASQRPRLGELHRLRREDVAGIVLHGKETSGILTRLLGTFPWQCLLRAGALGYLDDMFDLAGARAAAIRQHLPELPVLVAALRLFEGLPIDEAARAAVVEATDDAGPLVLDEAARLLIPVDPTRGERYARRALGLEPSHVRARLSLAWAVELREGPGPALAILLEHADPELDAEIARVATRAGEVDIAEAAFKRWTAQEPSPAAAWSEYACFLADARHDLQGAIGAARRPIESEPANVDHVRTLADFLGRAGRFEDAADRGCEVLQREPDPDVAAWCTRALLLAKKPDAAEALADDWIERNPDHPGLWNAKDRIALTRGDHAAAAKAAERAAQLAPDNAEYANSAAWHLFLLRKRPSHAVALARRAVTQADPSHTHTAATVLTWAGHWDEAVPHARHFLTEGDAAFITSLWDDIVLFFKEAVATGHAADARQLLIDTGRADAWRPLAEALAACAAGTDAHLKALLPEMRDPALMLYGRLSAGAARNAADRREAGPRKTPARGGRRGG